MPKLKLFQWGATASKGEGGSAAPRLSPYDRRSLQRIEHLRYSSQGAFSINLEKAIFLIYYAPLFRVNQERSKAQPLHLSTN
jgi:hypothetical protein